MLEKALFRKHKKLILFMALRRYFSQKEMIDWSLSNKEFKDKDSIENKGQYRDKLISFGILNKYSYREFLNIYPKEAELANKAYQGSQERKRCLLEFDSTALISLDYPNLKGMTLPFQEYIKDINSEKDLSEIVRAFVFGCSIQQILFLNDNLSKDMEKLIESRLDISEELLPLVEKARKIMEKWIKKKIEV